MNEIDVGISIGKLAHQAAPIYQLLNWEWYDTGVPEEEDIVVALLELYCELKETKLPCHNYLRTGGIKVERYLDENGEEHYVFSFEIREER